MPEYASSPPGSVPPPCSPASPRIGRGGDGGCRGSRRSPPSFSHFFPPRGASVLLRDRGASLDRWEVVCEVRYGVFVVEEAAATQRGGGSRIPSPGPSRQPAK